MSVLFSPVGTADPLTILGDGPMLHIVRQYRPQKVVLFLSPAMARFQNEDQRYSMAIELLAESEGFVMPELELIESDYEDVYRFDHYIAEFEGILERLSEEADGKPILVNATSGTPAMEQALVALGAFGRLNLKLLQVTTPNRGINAGGDRENPNGYDLTVLWELNESARNKRTENRVVEVESPHFADRLLRENVIALVNSYEYEAALELTNQMQVVNPQAKEMIQAASGRINLDGGLAAKVFGGSELAYKPNDLLLEYLYVMEMRLNQGHWAEFLRAMTPALTAIMERCLRPYLPESKYLQMESGRPTNKLDFESIDRDAGLRYVLGQYDKGKTTYVTNAILMELVENYCLDEHVKDLIRSVRDVESKCRNMLAHELCSSTKIRIEKIGKMPLETVMKHLFSLHGSAKPGLYKRINQAIVNQL